MITVTVSRNAAVLANDMMSYKFVKTRISLLKRLLKHKEKQNSISAAVSGPRQKSEQKWIVSVTYMHLLLLLLLNKKIMSGVSLRTNC